MELKPFPGRSRRAIGRPVSIMRDFIESEWGAQVVTWAQPTDDDGEVYEIVTAEGVFVRADSLPLLIASLGRLEPPRLRLVA